MEEFLRKLALWHTRTFKPIMTHEELEPIMATLGFVALPPTGAWREYVFSAGGCCRNLTPSEPLPRPRLPFPRIDGLHIYTYRAFFDAVAFFLGKRDIADHFHVRGMPLNRLDRPFDKKFRRMNDEEGLYVYREGTLEPATLTVYNSSSSTISSTGGNNSNSNSNISSNSNSNTPMSFVPLKDIIV
ncbi:uncharacterized protein LOC131219332 [Magnolia sinica]|uniref:uncharacterized protein LOC131219332 n=1 Tax=Magnolia sinica TaxID=86752 RepID=UPI0026586C10|nr:uncharacterized protein LOC131219332 [Magnolia sinica]